MTFTAEATNSGGEIFATFKINTSSVHYPLGYIVWGDDSATQNVASSAAPFPVRLYGNNSSQPVTIKNDSGNLVWVRGSGDSNNAVPVTIQGAGTGKSSSEPFFVTPQVGSTADYLWVKSAAPLAVTYDSAAGNYDATNSALRVSLVNGGNDTTVTIAALSTASKIQIEPITSSATPTFVTNNSATQLYVQADSNNPVYTLDQQANFIDSNNTSSAALSSATAFTGTGTDVSAYSAVTIMVHADEPSAASGMTFQFSTDNTNWDDVYRFSYSSNDTGGARRFQFPITSQYFRTVYTNGSSAQTAFRLQTILHRTSVMPSIHRLGDTALSTDRSVNVTKSAVVAQRGGTGNFIPVAASATGNLKIDISEGDNDSTAPVFVANSSTHPLYVSDSATPVYVRGLGDSTVPVSGTVTVSNSSFAVQIQQSDTVSIGSIANATGDTQMGDGIGGLQTFSQVTDTLGELYSITSSGARLYGWHLFNPSTAVDYYVKFHADDSTGITPGTTNAQFQVAVPFGGGNNQMFDQGISMSSGISVNVGTGTALNDTANNSVAMIVTLYYKDLSGT